MSRAAPAPLTWRFGLQGLCYPLTVSQPIRQLFSFQEYVLLEEMSTVKHEFLDGQAWAMAGGTPEHAALAANLVSLLQTGLRDQRCRVYTSDLRIRVKATGLGTYPDASVISDRVELDPDDPKGHTATNPVLLAEVLSPSTQDYDRGEKLEHYKQIPSLHSILLIAQAERRVAVWRRDDSGWSEETVVTGSVELTRLGCSIGIAELYFNPLAG